MVTPPFTAGDSLAMVLPRCPELADRLSSLHPALGRGRDRSAIEDMTERVTLADIARMAEVSEQALLDYVNGDEDVFPPALEPTISSPPDWVAGVDMEALPGLDVRPAIWRGEEPLPEVRKVAATIGEGGAFTVDAPFDPIPLRHLLGAQGFASHAWRPEPGRWRVLFRRVGTGDAGPGSGGGAAGEAKVWSVDDITWIDVRGLEAPRPLVAILEILEDFDRGDEVLVILERDPVLLYPELAERGWRWERLPTSSGEVRLRLTRVSPLLGIPSG